MTVEEGNMVVLGVMCGNAGSFTPPSGYTERSDFTASGTATMGSATLSVGADGSEQPTYTYNAGANRQALVGFAVRGTGQIIYAESSLTENRIV
jgi:hypothetical protein